MTPELERLVLFHVTKRFRVTFVQQYMYMRGSTPQYGYMFRVDPVCFLPLVDAVRMKVRISDFIRNYFRLNLEISVW